MAELDLERAIHISSSKMRDLEGRIESAEQEKQEAQKELAGERAVHQKLLDAKAIIIERGRPDQYIAQRFSNQPLQLGLQDAVKKFIFDSPKPVSVKMIATGLTKASYYEPKPDSDQANHYNSVYMTIKRLFIEGIVERITQGDLVGYRRKSGVRYDINQA